MPNSQQTRCDFWPSNSLSWVPLDHYGMVTSAHSPAIFMRNKQSREQAFSFKRANVIDVCESSVWISSHYGLSLDFHVLEYDTNLVDDLCRGVKGKDLSQWTQASQEEQGMVLGWPLGLWWVCSVGSKVERLGSKQTRIVSEREALCFVFQAVLILVP